MESSIVAPSILCAFASYAIYIECLELFDFYFDLAVSSIKLHEINNSTKYGNQYLQQLMLLLFKGRELLAHKYYANAEVPLKDATLNGSSNEYDNYLLALAYYKSMKFKETVRMLIGDDKPIGFIPDVSQIPEGPAGLYVLGQVYEKMQYRAEAFQCYLKCYNFCPIMWSAYTKLTKIAALAEFDEFKVQFATMEEEDEYKRFAKQFVYPLISYEQNEEFRNQLNKFLETYGSVIIRFFEDEDVMIEESKEEGVEAMMEALFYFEQSVWYATHMQPQKALDVLLNKKLICGLYFDLVGGCYYDLGCIAESMEAFSEIQTINPYYTNHFGVYSMMLMYYAKRFPRDGIEQLKSSIDLFVNENIRGPPLYCLQGCLHLLNNEAELAYDNFMRVIERDDSSAIGYYYLGLLSLTQRDSQIGMANFLIALQINPLMYQAYFGIAQLYLNEKHYMAAIFYLFETLKLNPHKITTWDILSVALHQAGYTQHALRLLCKGVRDHPMDLRYKYMCAINSMHFGDIELSIRAHFEIILEVHQNVQKESKVREAVAMAYSIALTQPSKAKDLLLQNIPITHNAASVVHRNPVESLYLILDVVEAIHEKHFSSNSLQ